MPIRSALIRFTTVPSFRADTFRLLDVTVPLPINACVSRSIFRIDAASAKPEPSSVSPLLLTPKPRSAVWKRPIRPPALVAPLPASFGLRSISISVSSDAEIATPFVVLIVTPSLMSTLVTLSTVVICVPNSELSAVISRSRSEVAPTVRLSPSSVTPVFTITDAFSSGAWIGESRSGRSSPSKSLSKGAMGRTAVVLEKSSDAVTSRVAVAEMSMAPDV